MKVSVPILCFDNQCILCSRMMQWYLRHEQSNRLVFTPIGSELYQSLGLDLENIDSILFINSTSTYQKSRAIFEIVSSLRGPYRLFKVFSFFPKSLLDGLYDIVAKRRYRLFGKEESGCEIGMMNYSRIILTKHQYLDYCHRLFNPKQND